jgi:acyl carrier protein
MDDDGVRARARAAVIEMAPIQDAEVTGGTELAADLGYDSLGLVHLASILEKEFGITDAADEDAIGVETVADVEERLVRLLSERAPEGRHR